MKNAFTTHFVLLCLALASVYASPVQQLEKRDDYYPCESVYEGYLVYNAGSYTVSVSMQGSSLTTSRQGVSDGSDRFIFYKCVFPGWNYYNDNFGFLSPYYPQGNDLAITASPYVDSNGNRLLDIEGFQYSPSDLMSRQWFHPVTTPAGSVAMELVGHVEDPSDPYQLPRVRINAGQQTISATAGTVDVGYLYLIGPDGRQKLLNSVGTMSMTDSLSEKKAGSTKKGDSKKDILTAPTKVSGKKAKKT